MQLLLIVIILQIFIIFTLILLALIKNKQICDYKQSKKVLYLFLSGPLLIVGSNLFNRYFSNFINHIHLRLYKLDSSGHTQIKTQLFIAELIATGQLIILFFCIVAFLNNDIPMIFTGLILGAILIVYKYRSLDKELVKRRRECISELPVFIHSLVLLINAGESNQSAFIRVAKSYTQITDSHLKRQLLKAMYELENGSSFITTLESLNQRVAVHEVSIFTTTLILNVRRGGKDLVLILENLANDFWARRISEARIIGEEASSKLVFPMLLIFVVVIMVLATPAILIF